MICLAASGGIDYATYLGGSNSDAATAIAVYLWNCVRQRYNFFGGFSRHARRILDHSPGIGIKSRFPHAPECERPRADLFQFSQDF